jgi:D-arabinitol 4-dehydrogenase
MLARFFIERPVFAIVISLVIVFAGLAAYGTLPIAQYPEITPPTVEVSCAYPGASASVVQDTIAALAAQNGVYTLETVTPQGERSYTRISSISRVIAWDAQLSGLVSNGAQDSTRIISFTVTEAGYYLDSKDRLDLGFADLQADLDAARALVDGDTTHAGDKRLHARALWAY